MTPTIHSSLQLEELFTSISNGLPSPNLRIVDASFHYDGRGSEQNNLQYNNLRFSYYNAEFGKSSPTEMKQAFRYRDSLFHTTLKKDFKQMDSFWRKVFELSERYLKGAEILRRCMFDPSKETWKESGLLTGKHLILKSNYNDFLHIYARKQLHDFPSKDRGKTNRLQNAEKVR